MQGHQSQPEQVLAVVDVEPSTESTPHEVSGDQNKESTAQTSSDLNQVEIATNPARSSVNLKENEEVPVSTLTENTPEAVLTAGESEAEESPATVVSTVDDTSGGEAAASMRIDKDGGTATTLPTVIVDAEGDSKASLLEDIITSPHGNNAIVERSPGGRYVRFMEKLGSGASKEVYRAYDTQEGIEVAWNVVHLAGVPKTERNRIVNEVRLLERLHHHNIISFHGSWVNREKQQVNFVTEILSSGTLQSFINKVQVIRWKIAKRWAKQILTGLEYLHSQDPPVIHRDLKCENIFINGTSGDLRIGDLGLSTVHRNGKALSVLGTPEFMAPDMYEENAYDEKVDIYAFGMCLLEMFTKEIPYRECSNPAQIYKKVTRGDPPDSLRRLKSRHAREFIELCLGKRDEDGTYIRPSATELMAHPFLQNRPSDDDEVEVDPPMQENAIREATESSSSSVKAVSATSSSPRTKVENRPASTDEEESDRFDEMPVSETSIRQPKVLVGRGQELQRDDKLQHQTHERQSSGGSSSDMPSSQPTAACPAVPPAVRHTNSSTTSSQQNSASLAGSSSVQHDQGATQTSSSLHYLVAAAVIEDELPNSQPYEDDILKLVVTLPVDGQTQNVQFDFHLVQDDAIQVAKEMVAELDIPSAAVLEISETISGLARAARVKQDKYMAKVQKKPHGHVRSHSQGVLPQPRSEILHQQQQASGHALVQQQSHQSIPDFGNAQVHGQSAPAALPVQQNRPQDQSTPLHQQGVGQHAPIHLSHQQHHGDAPLRTQHQQTWNAHVGPGQTGQSPGPTPVDPALVSGSQSFGHAHPLPNHQSMVRNVSNGGETDLMSASSSTYAQPTMQPPPIATPQQNHGSISQLQDVPGQATTYINAPQAALAQPAMQKSGAGVNNGVGASSTFNHQSQAHAHIATQPMNPGLSSQVGGVNASGTFQSTEQEIQPQYAQSSSHVNSTQSQTGQAPTQQVPSQQNLVAQGTVYAHAQTSSGTTTEQSLSKHPIVTQQVQPQVHPRTPQHHSLTHPPSGISTAHPQQVAPAGVSASNSQPPSRVGGLHDSSIGVPSSVTQHGSIDGLPVSKDTHVNGVHEVPSFEADDALDDELLASELRKLDEDFKKNMARAQKVFDTRMDNLQRSQVQREAQHLKTLEKHEKERADFEKRRQQEEIEQNKRIEQLQKDWASRREAMRQKQVAEGNSDTKTTPINSTSGPSQ